MFGLSMEKFLLIVLLAVLILGPDRIPYYAKKLGELVRKGKRMLDNEIWGQGFPAPVFDDVFRVERQRLLKDKHLKLDLCRNTARYEAIQFNHAGGAPEQIHAAYRLGINEFRGVSSVQLMLEHFEAA